MASQAQVPAEPEIVRLKNALDKGAEQFRAVLPSHITPEKFQRTILTAVQSDPDLLLADRQSLLLACMKAAQDGLLPDKREAAFVIFSNRVNRNGKWESVKFVQYMPMVYGLRKKILQSGAIKDITTRVVYRSEYASGAFVYEEGTNATLRHRPALDLTEAEAADSEIIAAYSIATFDDGSQSVEVMRRFEIDKVRQASQTGAVGRIGQFGDMRGKPIEPKGPWVDWFPEQCKKTVMRRHSKTLPMSSDLVDVEPMDDVTAAHSSMNVLGAADALPPPAPTRAAIAEQATAHPIQTGPDFAAVDALVAAGPANSYDQEVDGDGVVKEAAKEPAKPEAAADMTPIFDDFSARISRCTSVASLPRIVNEIEASPLTDDWKSTLRTQAAEKQVALKGGAK